ncbi:WGR domain protein [Leptospira santarosai str. HAI1349]|nr:WGR domain protein [Leptospira santarosai str. HAI1349]
MNIKLTFTDDKSDKFWNIEVGGTSFTVTYGKTGTIGQTQTKTFDDEKKCLKEAEKLLAEKLKKGYLEVGIEKNDSSNMKKKITKSENGYLQEWETIVKSKDLPKALVRHFAYLADTKGYQSILNSIFNQVEKVQIEPEGLVLLFKKGFKLIADPPGDLKKYNKWPKTFQEKIAYHSTLAFIDTNDMGIILQEVDLDPINDLELDTTELNEYPLQSKYR